MSAPRGRQHSWSLRSVGDGSGIHHPSVVPESLSPECVCVCVCVCAHVCHVMSVSVCKCVCVCAMCVHMCAMCIHLYAMLCVCAHVCHVCVHEYAVCVCPCTPSNARSSPILALTSFQGSICGGKSLQPRSSVAHAPPHVGAPGSRITEGRCGVAPAAMTPLPFCHVPHQGWNSCSFAGLLEKCSKTLL